MKSRSTYKLLTFLGLIWVLPINRIYLGEKGIILRIFTLNYLWFGAFFDLFYMDKRFDEAMAKRGFINVNGSDRER